MEMLGGLTHAWRCAGEASAVATRCAILARWWICVVHLTPRSCEAKVNFAKEEGLEAERRMVWMMRRSREEGGNNTNESVNTRREVRYSKSSRNVRKYTAGCSTRRGKSMKIQMSALAYAAQKVELLGFDICEISPNYS
jgi:hypothetical protein